MIISAKESIKKASQTLKEKYTGGFAPLKTSYSHFNEITKGGIIPGKIYSIAAMSGYGKTHMLKQIEDDIFDEKLNPTAKDNVLLVRVDLEMLKEELLVRKIQKRTHKKIEDIYFKEPTEEEKIIYNDVYLEECNPNIFEPAQAYTPTEFYDNMSTFFEEHKDKQQIVVTIDHINLIRKDFSNPKGSVDELLDFMVELKKKYSNVSFIALAQLNREIKKRRTNKDEHAPMTSDLFNTSLLEFAADVLLVIHNPYKLGIESYMVVNPERYPHLQKYMEITKRGYANFRTKGLLFYHYLKVRMVDDMQEIIDIYVEELYEVEKEEKQVITRESLVEFEEQKGDDLPF